MSLGYWLGETEGRSVGSKLGEYEGALDTDGWCDGPGLALVVGTTLMDGEDVG